MHGASSGVSALRIDGTLPTASSDALTEPAMSFRIRGLDPAPFLPLYGLDDDALAARGVVRVIADATPGYPDRIALRDAEPGEPLLLLNHVHQPADTPFRASHAIYVCEAEVRRHDAIDSVPEVLRRRTLSWRAFDARDWLIDAGIVDGRVLESAIERAFATPAVAYLHLHYAGPGCYAARVDCVAEA
jgi:hypothetical protein